MRNALVVIDYINDLVHPDGKRGIYARQVSDNKVLAQVNKAISWARKTSALLVFVKVGFSADYRDLPTNSPFFSSLAEAGALRLGRWGTEFHQDLAIQPDDLIVIKPRINPFYSTRLEAILRAAKVTDIYFSGVGTTWAVQSAVRTAHDLDYHVFVISDACAAASEEEHLQSLTTLSHLSTLCTADDLKGSFLR
ncbi:isochorismatase family cysteine hydrolase [Endozoicomonas sp. SCSIO W0465]|uniref:isochorismatase family cysteine hydrolase n=1 Tax=Endozoicomonas sp. SCSIO W0465 TaxID=2918516 RepID=UPI0020762ED2|nr:isochorismatase family cysteine hydrolase [Endozoicomonas sp. SCSIO W0465]USE35366.1 cysteine hydrolase [Endozoicomonas sp. SCSIO W0465]